MEPEILKYRVKKNYNAVVKDIEPKKLLGYLYQEDVFDEDEMDEVREERTRKKQAEAMLSMLKRKPGGYEVLVKSLEETQPHLARLLQTPIDGEKTGIAPQENCLSPSDEIKGLMQQLQNLQTNPTENDNNAATKGYTSGSFILESNSYPHFNPANEHSEECTDFFVQPTNLELISPLYRPNSLDSLESVYKMTRSPRGLALIVNIDNFDSVETSTGETLVKRDGSDVDEKALVDLFTALDFETKTLVDHNKDGLRATLENMAKSDLSWCDCFVLCIMSHGKEGFFYTRDGGEMTIKSTLEIFNNANCKTLCGKPKLYFVQACRGKYSDQGAVVKDAPSGTPTEHEEPQKPPEKPQYSFNLKPRKGPSTGEHADQLVAYSSVEGFASYRNTRAGSRFIQSLVEVFKYYASVEDVESMMTRVIKKVNSQGDFGSKQVPKPETTLTKKVFFWPGMKFDQYT